MKTPNPAWKWISEIASLKTPWIELVGEHWRDDAGKDLEYWRTVAPDSVIVIPELNGQFLLPAPMFRPGVNRETLDFPGGRLKDDHTPTETAGEILKRELGVQTDAIAALRTINPMPLLINSSTSSQRLHGFHAVLDPQTDRSALTPHQAYATEGTGLQDLLDRLDCLQCRALLQEHLRMAD